MTNLFDAKAFDGKVFLITGGTAGIGRGCCESFCAAGATVIICARKTDEVFVEEMNRATSGTCSFMKCDISDPQQIEAMIAGIIGKYGRLDGVINNAGWHPPDQRIDQVSIADFTELLQINLVSIFTVCKLTLPHLRKTQGNIINMASLVGSMGQANACSYVTSKSAIIGLTKALAIDEAEHGVRVNCVSPAAIRTPLADSIMADAADPQTELAWVESWHHLRRFGTIEECGQVCLFLASPAASFITGADIPISGGAELAYGNKFK